MPAGLSQIGLHVSAALAIGCLIWLTQQDLPALEKKVAQCLMFPVSPVVSYASLSPVQLEKQKLMVLRTGILRSVSGAVCKPEHKAQQLRLAHDCTLSFDTSPALDIDADSKHEKQLPCSVFFLGDDHLSSQIFRLSGCQLQSYAMAERSNGLCRTHLSPEGYGVRDWQ